MRVKSFYGKSIKEALDKARKELGPDAAIVASRQLRPEEGKGCEVVCGLGEDAPAMPAPAPAAAPPAAPVPAPRQKDRGVTRIRKGIEAMVRSTSDDGFGSDAVRLQLLAAGFAQDLTDEIVAGVRQKQRQGGKGGPAHPAAESLFDELSSRLSFSPHLGSTRSDRRVVALVGPPGAGKTSTLVKLAVRYGLTARLPMHIISMDSWRIGGTDALRTYAADMAVTFEALETANALSQSLQEHSGKGLILIDTPGLGPNDMKPFGQLASLLSSHQDTEVHLVVPAWMSPSAMSGLFARFRPFLPSRLLTTGADCVDSCLPVAGLALNHEKPVSFIGTGQTIPEDIEEAGANRLLAALRTGALKDAASSAA